VAVESFKMPVRGVTVDDDDGLLDAAVVLVRAADEFVAVPFVVGDFTFVVDSSSLSDSSELDSSSLEDSDSSFFGGVAVR
jgi:hypothetical protein